MSHFIVTTNTKYSVFHEHTKYIEVDSHFTHDKDLEGLIQLSYLLNQEPDS